VTALLRTVDEEEEAPVERVLATGRTDADGNMAGALIFPADVDGPAELIFTVQDGDVSDLATAEVELLTDARILLVTDKPLYQPGQTMHLRALALQRAGRAPLGDHEVVFEVSDSAGNKVMRERVLSNAFGIAATTFTLARQVNMGEYRIKAVLDEVEVEKQVTVERYTLPKYRVTLALDKPYYLPGERVEGTVSAQYFFGQPVAGGAVSVSAAAFDVEFTTFAEHEGTLNAEGLYRFAFDLPSYLVGTSLEQGNALIKVDATVRDLADHEQTVSRTTVVARAGVDVTLLPESGVLIPGVPNRIFVIVSDPMGAPLSDAHVTVNIPGHDFTVALDAQGIGRILVTPAAGPLQATVTVTPAGGEPVVLSLSLLGGGIGRTLLLRTDRPIYEVGDTLLAEVLLARPHGRVFVDVVHGGRTVRTDALDVIDGRAEWSVEVDAALSGAVQLSAYFLGDESEIVRDGRLVYVEAADGLQVRLLPDQEIYRPGDPARVAVEVTDGEGRPKVAALGVQVVDEAVFALQESQPGLLKVYFELEEALRTPNYQFAWPSLSPEEVIEPEEPPASGGGIDADRAARAEVAFAAQEGGSEVYGVALNTRRERIEAAGKVLAPAMEAFVTTITSDLQQANLPHFDADAVSDRLAEMDLVDFWGRPFHVERRDEEVIVDQWGWAPEDNVVWHLISDGPDKRSGTADDVVAKFSLYDIWWGRGWEEDGWFNDADGGMLPGAGGGEPPPAAEPDEEGPGGVRIRSYFPETLHVDPAVITDGDGRAHRVHDGRLHHRVAHVGARQLHGRAARFHARRGSSCSRTSSWTSTSRRRSPGDDVVSVPIAIYNYLDIPQTVRLEAEAGRLARAHGR
jgi:alpha-2-macroglobulin-like protein